MKISDHDKATPQEITNTQGKQTKTLAVFGGAAYGVALCGDVLRHRLQLVPQHCEGSALAPLARACADTAADAPSRGKREAKRVHIVALYEKKQKKKGLGKVLFSVLG